MTIAVKDANGATQTIKTNDDLASSPGTSSANVLTVQGAASGVALPVSASQLGEVAASPTANTVLARLKDILTGIVLAAGTNVIGFVNLITGQTGIAGGAGPVSANTTRTTLASDDPAVAALQIMDDWDESDRAKVNPIVGQAGVAAGSGSVGATTQRVTLANDDPTVAALQIMDDWDESDRAKVNPIAGQAGVAAGAGAVNALTQRVVLASDDTGVTRLTAMARSIEGDYETVAASQTDQVLGGTGAAGDYLSAVLIIPATTSPGAVSIKDGSGSAITIFTGGASSVSNLVPVFVPLGVVSTGGAWKVTTGSAVSVLAIGSFSA